ncbi:MAG TPA: lamin tail domain-containing protein, partial [Candidatus Dormibacteraeota bacterium]|nr:lamin tail domain-containing protein [Candidatus Dormibacteraeota bacterium]
MYNPITGNNNDEYIELYNRSGVTQDLSGWHLRGGIDFNFPSNTLMAPAAYLVVAENKTNLLAHYANLNNANTVGDYGGSLGNSGERIALLRPVININFDTNSAAFVTNRIFVPVNDLTYGDGGRWGDWSDGGGSSLELKDPNSDNRQPGNWGDSDESAKAPWTSIEITGNIGANQQSPSHLQVFDLGVGEFLLDDVEVRNSGLANLVPNPGLESGLTSWVLQGSHDQSSLENTGFSGNRSLHVRAASRGDNGANRVRVGPLIGVASVNVTLRAKVRWLRGWPEVLLRLNGGGLECPGKMTVPYNLGTPGAPNSQAITNAGPAIYEVTHSPALPLAQENVVVTARVSDPDGVARLTVKYRLDATLPGSFISVPMVDDGSGDDAVAADGIYSATIPGRPTGAAVSFYIEAADAAGAINTFPQNVFPAAGLTRCFPYDSMTRECVVRWGDRQLSGSIPSYHLWCTLANIGRWDARDDLNNAPMDGTFVYNNYRVVYNARPQFAGSPWHQGQMTGGPTNNGSRVDYVCNFPEDDRFLGATDTVLATTGNPESNHGTDNSAQTEQASYIIFREMGLQYNHRRWIHLFINGNERSMGDNLNPSGQLVSWVMEDTQQPNADMVEEWFPDDSDGELFKIEDWFEFTDAGTRGPNEDADLGRRENVINGKTVLNPAPYRFMWRKRAVNSGESANDFRSISELINTVSPTATYTELSNLPIPDPAAFDRLADVEEWMRIFSVQHAVGNWDSYGYERGKNAYTYKPKGGRFVQWTWDIDFTMGVGGNGATTSVYSLGGDGDRRVEGMWGTPVIRRMYWRAFEDMMNGPWNNSYMDPILDAKAAALAAHG